MNICILWLGKGKKGGLQFICSWNRIFYVHKYETDNRKKSGIGLRDFFIS